MSLKRRLDRIKRKLSRKLVRLESESICEQGSVVMCLIASVSNKTELRRLQVFARASERRCHM